MNRETFDKIRKAKNLNRSARDRLKNLNIRSKIILKVILDRGERWLVTNVEIDDSMKHYWYRCYSYCNKQSTSELARLYFEIFKEYVKLDNLVKYRGKYVLKLRGNKWSV